VVLITCVASAIYNLTNVRVVIERKPVKETLSCERGRMIGEHAPPCADILIAFLIGERQEIPIAQSDTTILEYDRLPTVP
jgi:hypothetical protein